MGRSGGFPYPYEGMSLDLGLFFITLKIMRICLLVVGLFWSLRPIYSADFTGLKRFGNLSSRGIAWGDFDNDGQLDVAVSNIEGDMVYQKKESGEFVLFFPFAPDTSWGIGFVDLDNNGYLDLLVISRDTLRIYKNEAGKFMDSSLIWVPNARSLAFGDYNNDSYIDIAIACIGQNRLLRNEDDFLFNSSNQFGGDSSYSISWADYDDDGDLDIAVANLDKGVKLYRNEDNNYFTEIDITLDPGSHSIAWGDYDNDGWLDLAVGYLGDFNRLYHNDSGDSFPKNYRKLGISQDNTISIAWADYDNDGDLDLAVSNLGQPNTLYENDNNGHKFDYVEPFDQTDSSYGIAWGDYDNDGDLDLAVANYGENTLYKNNPTGTRRIKLRLKGRGEPYSNSYGVGAKVKLLNAYNDSLVSYREVRTGGGFCSQDALEIIFGVPGDIYNIVIVWPSGIVDSLKGIGPYYENTIDEDIRPPQNPTKVWSDSHNEDEWSNKPIIKMAWYPGKDSLGSGVMGYSFLFDKNPFTIPDTIIDIDTTTTESKPLSEGNWYFHLRTIDSVGNPAVDPAHCGPYKIDTTSPSTPSLITPPNEIYTNQLLIDFVWHPGVDTLSGIMKYAIPIALDSLFDYPQTHFSKDTTVRLGPLPEDTILFWRVKAVDSAGNDGGWSEIRSFIIDTTAPKVEYTFPGDRQQGVHPTTNLMVGFVYPETIDSLSINHTSFKVVNTATSTSILPDSIKFDGTYWWVFYPKGLLPEDALILCTLTKDIRNFAGNHLPHPYSWSFTTGKAKDSIPPIISEMRAIPEKVTEEDTLLIIEATAEDTGEAVSNIVKVEYFIDSIVEGKEHIMKPKDGNLDSAKEEVVDTLLTENLIPGIRKFLIRAQDGSGNIGSCDTLRVKVVGDTSLILEIETKPERVSPGDTLDITIKAKNKKGEWRILKYIGLYVKMDDKIENISSITTPDSINFYAKYVPSGVYIGEAWLICDVMDIINNSTEDTVSFFIEPAHDSFPKKGVYAWPNPAAIDEIHFHYTLRADADAVRLSVYTLDGKLLYKEERENVLVDKAENFTVNLNKFSNGIYLFKIDAKFGNKTKKVIKKFAVVR